MAQYQLIPFTEQDTPRLAAYREKRCLRRWHRQCILASIGLLLIVLLAAVVFHFQDVQPVAVPQTFSPEVESYNSSLLAQLWPAAEPNRTDSWETENSKTIHSLLTCMATNTCKENQTSIVLLSARHFAWVLQGWFSGEQIWARSVMTVLGELGYTMIFAPDAKQLAKVYPLFPSLVKVVLIEDFDVLACYEDPQCIKSSSNPHGVPAWKMLTMSFWQGPDNPLGSAWTVGPEPWSEITPWSSLDNVYMGYSVERTCMQIPTTPFEQRPRRVYILAKLLSFFYEDGFPWQNVSLVDPSVGFVAGIQDNTEGKHVVPEGIHNLGLMKQPDFYRELGNSRALLGIGNPAISPSPYDALCMGVPFINPILHWDSEHPDDSNRWITQHDGLRGLRSPYVYHVHRGDAQGFWSAVSQAMDNPIDRYVLPTMTMEALKLRVGEIIERDWKTKAEKLLVERKKSGDGKLFDI